MQVFHPPHTRRNLAINFSKTRKTGKKWINFQLKHIVPGRAYSQRAQWMLHLMQHSLAIQSVELFQHRPVPVKVHHLCHHQPERINGQDLSKRNDLLTW